MTIDDFLEEIDEKGEWFHLFLYWKMYKFYISVNRSWDYGSKTTKVEKFIWF
jgi:hypothetical protein